MREPDETYFKRRAVEERLAAERATHPSAERDHLGLSGLYEDAANERRTTVGVVSLAERRAVTPLGVSRDLSGEVGQPCGWMKLIASAKDMR